MNLTTIGITNFRNISSVEAVELPADALLVAAAPNAFGKTNFLESVAVLLRGKSFRAKASECVAWGKDSFTLHGEVDRLEGDGDRVAVRYHQPTRKIRIERDGEPASIVSFYAHYPLVLFLPSDTFLLSRGPAQRRNFLNQVLVAHQPYLSALVQYQRALRQRNSVLKQADGPEEAEAWTQILCEHAAVLWKHRDNAARFIDARLGDVYGALSGETRSLSAHLEPGAPDREAFKDELTSAWRYEKRYGYTLYGPHRDDLTVTVDDLPVTSSMSRGQMRSLTVALKVLAHHYIKQITKESPLLLLDDVLSELDDERQAALLDNLPSAQTLLTCTALPQTLTRRDDVYLLDLRTIVDQKGEERTTPVNEKEEIVDEPAAEDDLGEDVLVDTGAATNNESAEETLPVRHVERQSV